MPLSERTKTVVASLQVLEADDYFPNYGFHATQYPNSATPLMRLSDEVPRTTVDMSKAQAWKHGDKLYGTQAKKAPGLRLWRNDINKAWGKERRYDHNMIFINTYKPIGDQLKRLKK